MEAAGGTPLQRDSRSVPVALNPALAAQEGLRTVGEGSGMRPLVVGRLDPVAAKHPNSTFIIFAKNELRFLIDATNVIRRYRFSIRILRDLI